MTRYEPHCDCLGGHVSMVPDPNGRWCRAEVKPLEWVDLGDGKAFRALLPIIGSIRVEPYGCCDWWEVLWSMPGQCDKLIPDVFDNPDDAKAAAQAAVDARILSAFVEADHA